MRNKRRLIPIIAAGHFVVSAAVLLAAFALFFNDNKGEELRAIREFLTQLGEILCFPMLPRNSDWLFPRFGWYSIPVILIANSFLWAISLYGLGALFSKIKNKVKRPMPAPLSLFCLFALLSFGLSASAQTAFNDVPRSHWANADYARLVKAKLAEYPTCSYTRPLKSRALTRYEFAVVVIRAIDSLSSQRKLTPEQTQLIPILRRMAREFAPEIRQLRPPQKKPRPIGV